MFGKKHDPISERAKILNQQIAALEAEILKLSKQQDHAASEAPDQVPLSQPRLRSTARPHGQNPQPVFEEVNHDRIQTQPEPDAPAHDSELGVRKHDLASGWERFKGHFRGPVASNPKLVHYLSAGGIQGLRPLRYEKRVARNRFIALAVILLLALWGIIAIFVSRQ